MEALFLKCLIDGTVPDKVHKSTNDRDEMKIEIFELLREGDKSRVL